MISNAAGQSCSVFKVVMQEDGSVRGTAVRLSPLPVLVPTVVAVGLCRDKEKDALCLRQGLFSVTINICSPTLVVT